MFLEVLQVLGWLIVGILIILVATTMGSDFGVGILSKVVGKNDLEKRTIINVMAATWDGSQVWFISAGGALFAIWPQVYATSFSGLYIAILLVLWGLFLRPPAIEYRKKVDSDKWRNFWDLMLFLGSVIPIVVMGVAIGNLYIGFPISYDETGRLIYGSIVNGHYQSMWYTLFKLLSPFALLFGIFALNMAVMQGSNYCKLRTSGSLRARFKKISTVTSSLFLVLFIIAGLWLFFKPGFQWNAQNLTHYSDALTRPWGSGDVVRNSTWYYNYTNHFWMWIAPIVAIAGSIGIFKYNKLDRDWSSFFSGTLAIIGAIFTVGFALFPFVMPSTAAYKYSLTIWNASSGQNSLTGIIIVAFIIVPIVFYYTYFVYRKIWANGRRISVEEVSKNGHDFY